MPYHYLRPRTDRPGSREAEFAIAVMLDAGWKPRGKRFKTGTDAPMVLDIESKLNEKMLAKMTGAQVLHYAEEFAGTVAEQTGRDVLTYLSPGFMPELGNKAPAHGEDVWVAAFSFTPGKPPTPQGFSKDRVRAHQFSEHGTFPGVGLAVDLDLWLGDAKSLRRWIEGDPTPGGGGPISPDPSLSTTDAQTFLKEIGWPIKVTGTRTPETAQAIKDFQRGYVGDPPVKPLREDGIVDPKTEEALRWSVANGGRCSKNFKFKEFASKKSGWIRTHRELVAGLETLREHVGHPIGVLGLPRLRPGRVDEPAQVRQRDRPDGDASPLLGDRGAQGLLRHRPLRNDGPRSSRRRAPCRPEHHRRHEGQADDLRRRVLSGNNRAWLSVYISDGRGRSSNVPRR